MWYWLGHVKPVFPVLLHLLLLTIPVSSFSAVRGSQMTLETSGSNLRNYPVVEIDLSLKYFIAGYLSFFNLLNRFALLLGVNCISKLPKVCNYHFLFVVIVAIFMNRGLI